LRALAGKRIRWQTKRTKNKVARKKSQSKRGKKEDREEGKEERRKQQALLATLSLSAVCLRFRHIQKMRERKSGREDTVS